MAACAADPGVGLVRRLLDGVDCQVETLAIGGYEALAAPQSMAGGLIGGLLTLYVAMFGYRLILGRAPFEVGEATLSVLKIGLVLALATQWAAYQAVVHDVVFHGPGQITGLLLSIPADNAFFRHDVFAGLQYAVDEFAASSAAAAGGVDTGKPAPATGLGGASLVMTVSTLGLILASKVAVGLLLALGPLFIALALFVGTRGAAVGWLRGLVGFAVVPLAVTVALAIELTMLEPILSALSQSRARGVVDETQAQAALAVVLVFALVKAGGAIATAVVAGGLSWPVSGPRRAAPALDAAAASWTPAAAGRGPAVEIRSHATSVAAAAAAIERRARGGSEAVTKLAFRTPEGVDLQPAPAARRVDRLASHRSSQPRHGASTERRDR